MRVSRGVPIFLLVLAAFSTACGGAREEKTYSLYRTDSVEQVSAAQMAELVRKGEVDGATLVANGTEWVPLAQHPDGPNLLRASPSAAAPEPAPPPAGKTFHSPEMGFSLTIPPTWFVGEKGIVTEGRTRSIGIIHQRHRANAMVLVFEAPLDRSFTMADFVASQSPPPDAVRRRLVIDREEGTTTIAGRQVRWISWALSPGRTAVAYFVENSGRAYSFRFQSQSIPASMNDVRGEAVALIRTARFD